MISILAVAAFLLSLWLLIEGAEWFTKGVFLTARAVGAPAYAIAFLAGGVDFDNLAVGIAASVQGLPEVATGSVVGSTLFFLTAGVGIAILIAPLTLRLDPLIALVSALPLLCMLLLGSDDILGRLDGAAVLVVSIASLTFVMLRGEPRLKERSGSLAKALVRLGAAVLAIASGAELFRWSVTTLFVRYGVDQTLFAMLIVGAAVTLEEIPKIAGAARAGHPEIALATIGGTLVFNAGVNPALIALLRPLEFARANAEGWTLSLAAAAVLVLAWLALRPAGRRTGSVIAVAWLLIALAQVAMR